MSYSRAVWGCGRVAWRLARYLDKGRTCKDPWRCGWSPGRWGYGLLARLPGRERSHMTEIVRPVISPHLALLLSVILLFPLWSNIIAFSYFVISMVIWHYCFQLFCYFHCDLTLLLLVILLFPWWSDIIVFSYFVIFIVIYHYDFRLLWHCDLTLLSFVVKSNMSSLFHLSITITASSIWSYLLYDDLSKMQKRKCV